MFILNLPKLYSFESGESMMTLEKLAEINRVGMLSPSLIDIEWLMCQPTLPFLVQVLPAHLLYRSLLAHGLEDSLEIVEWVRGEQLQKILDFDIWEKSFEYEVEDISIGKILSWLQAWLAIGSEFAAKRFLELEEEYICLILSKIFVIVPDGLSNVTEEIRENWWLTPDKKFFLKIRENEEDYFEVLKQFVDSLYAYDIRLAGSLFAYSSMLVRQETLESGLHWRRNRLSEQGFVSSEDARQVLIPKKISDLKKLIEEAKAIEIKKSQVSSKYSHLLFFDKETEHINTDFSSEEFDSIIRLITSLEPEEGVKYAYAALGEGKIKSLESFSNVPPVILYEDQDFINEVSESILSLAKKVALNLEFRTVKKEDARLLIEKSILHIANEDRQKLVELKESIAYLANCVTACNETNFNFHNIENSILVTRGAINIGLELCLKMPEEYGINLKHNDKIFNSIDCLNSLGINFLFHLGWNSLFNIGEKLAQKIVDLDMNHKNYKGKLNTLRSIQLSDNSVIRVTLDKLVANLRFADIGKWLTSCELLFSNELFFTIKALLSRVPYYSETLTREKEDSRYVTKKTRPFETLEDVDSAFNFLENLSQNLAHIKDNPHSINQFDDSL